MKFKRKRKRKAKGPFRRLLTLLVLVIVLGIVCIVWYAFYDMTLESDGFSGDQNATVQAVIATNNAVSTQIALGTGTWIHMWTRTPQVDLTPQPPLR